MSEFPDQFLFIIGSPKAGTTSLARWLDQRDDMVLGAEKEPRYFTDFSNRSWRGPGSDEFKATMLRDINEYRANYSPARTGKALGSGSWGIDASTDYLWCPASAEKIKEFSRTRPSKLICILRDPVERALSEFHHTLRDRLEELDLPQSLDLEEQRMRDGWQPLYYHKRRSTCLADLERFHRLFGNDLLILGFHEFKNPNALLKKVHDFLGLDGASVSASRIENQSILPRNKFWQRIFSSQIAKSIGRTVSTPAMRDRIKRKTHKPARNLNTTGTQDVELLRQILADEIAACQASALVDTGHWTTATRG